MKLPNKGDPPLEIQACGFAMFVKRTSRDWMAWTNNPQDAGRRRWGNKREIGADIYVFQQCGSLPTKHKSSFA